jgi:hypothetical protein
VLDELHFKTYWQLRHFHTQKTQNLKTPWCLEHRGAEDDCGQNRKVHEGAWLTARCTATGLKSKQASTRVASAAMLLQPRPSFLGSEQLCGCRTSIPDTHTPSTMEIVQHMPGQPLLAPQQPLEAQRKGAEPALAAVCQIVQPTASQRPTCKGSQRLTYSREGESPNSQGMHPRHAHAPVRSPGSATGTTTHTVTSPQLIWYIKKHSAPQRQHTADCASAAAYTDLQHQMVLASVAAAGHCQHNTTQHNTTQCKCNATNQQLAHTPCARLHSARRVVCEGQLPTDTMHNPLACKRSTELQATFAQAPTLPALGLTCHPTKEHNHHQHTRLSSTAWHGRARGPYKIHNKHTTWLAPTDAQYGPCENSNPLTKNPHSFPPTPSPAA